ncbi:MAG: protein adenylyltransferase SelO family protein [Myxococcota bacterium]
MKVRPLPSRWDALPLLGVGATGQVLRDGRRVIKVAHSGPEARARLLEEARLHRVLERAGVAVPRLRRVDRHGRFLVRDFVAEAPFGRSRAPTDPELRACFALWRQVAALEARLDVRLDVSPSNLVVVKGRAWLLDAGRRVAPPVFRAAHLAAFKQEWRTWLRTRERHARLEPLHLPPSGRFHVETPLGETKGRVLWRNAGLLARLGWRWSGPFLQRLGAWSTLAKASTAKPSTRYVDMIRLDRRLGPRGDGRAVVLGVVRDGDGVREVSLKGCGPTPLAWTEREFHSDGLVSLPRTLWEVSIADELARLGFDVPEYAAVLSTPHRTFDNTRRWWPAAVGVRVAKTHWRLGHLRAFCHRPDAFRALLRRVGAQLVRADFEPSSPQHVGELVRRFAENLGFDVGRTDALQIHCFNPTPGNVRLDGHFIDFSTVRFFRHYVPDFRFLEHRYGVRLHRVAWQRQVKLLCEVLEEAKVASRLSRDAAVRRYERAYVDGFFAGLARCYPLRPATPAERRRLVIAASRAREVRCEREEDFPYWKQRCPGPRFDLLGKAPEVVAALRRGHAASWKVLLVHRDDEVPPAERRLGERFLTVLAPLLDRDTPGRRWSEVIRPALELEALAHLCYGRSTPRDLSAWAQAISTSRHLFEGRYDYFSARAAALGLGHVVLPTVDGRGFEVVVGLTPELLEAIRRGCREVLGRRLVGIVAHGSRVMERRRVKVVDPRAFTHNDLRLRGPEGLREFGPSPARSSDLDLKVFVRGGGDLRSLELELGARLAALGAWLPLSAHRTPRQRLIQTTRRSLPDAFHAWNGGPRRVELGKGPIPDCQAVVLDDGRGGPPLDGWERFLASLPRVEAMLDEGAGGGDRSRRSKTTGRASVEVQTLRLPKQLDLRRVHLLELAMRVDRGIQPRVRRSGQRVVEGAEVVEAARRAGRRFVFVSGGNASAH